jgi:hypothetical protein
MKCGLILCSSLAACTPQASDTVVSAAVVPETVKAISAPSPSPTGGYAHADPFAAEVQEAARFAVQAQAVDTHSRLIYKDVLTAQTQVVAGQNYLLSLAVTEDGKPRQAHVKVWRQLNNRYVLTQWDWMP